MLFRDSHAGNPLPVLHFRCEIIDRTDRWCGGGTADLLPAGLFVFVGRDRCNASVTAGDQYVAVLVREWRTDGSTPLSAFNFPISPLFYRHVC